MDSVSISLSGLMVQNNRMATAASNIANVTTVGSIPTDANPTSNVYKPLSVSAIALSNYGDPAGVRSVINEDDSFSVIYDPGSIYADAEGFIAAPDVSLEREAVNMMVAKNAYKANLNVLKTQREMLGELLEIVS